jgi:hypothetical protein
MLGSVEDDYSEGNLHSNKTRIKQENVRIMKQRDAFMDARNKGIPPYGTSISLGAFVLPTGESCSQNGEKRHTVEKDFNVSFFNGK